MSGTHRIIAAAGCGIIFDDRQKHHLPVRASIIQPDIRTRHFRSEGGYEHAILCKRKKPPNSYRAAFGEGVALNTFSLLPASFKSLLPTFLQKSTAFLQKRRFLQKSTVSFSGSRPV
ncbi:MAG: hypothetical protein II192_08440, partial [Clostridia bacterium]|nr:hypothetical protein [Clostridia bacterium]